MMRDRGSKICPNMKMYRLISWYFLAGKECISINFSDSTTDKTEKLKDKRKLSEQWETIDWKIATKEVNRLQVRIARQQLKMI